MSSSRTRERLEKASLVAGVAGFVNAAFSYLNYNSPPAPACPTISLDIVNWNTTNFAQGVYHMVNYHGISYLKMLKSELIKEIPYHIFNKINFLFEGQGAVKYITDNAFYTTFYHVRSLYDNFTRAGLLNVCVQTIKPPVAIDYRYQLAATIAVSLIGSYYLLSSSEPEMPIIIEPLTQNLKVASEVDDLEAKAPQQELLPQRFTLFNRTERMMETRKMRKFYGNIPGHEPSAECIQPRNYGGK